MIAQQGEGVWRIVAVVDLSCPDADRVVQNAVTLGDRLRGEVTLVSVVARNLYERGVRYRWPQNAFGRTCPEVDIHRVALPGTPAEAVATYADRIRADVIVIPARYKLRRWLRKQPLAQAIAALTSIPLWIVPAGAGTWTADVPLRVACMLRLDSADEGLCMAAQSVLHRCGGELVLTYGTGDRSHPAHDADLTMDRDTVAEAIERLGRSLDARWSAHLIENCSDDAVTASAAEGNFGLIVASRPTYGTSGANFGDLLPLVDQLPCPVLSIPSY